MGFQFGTDTRAVTLGELNRFAAEFGLAEDTLILFERERDERDVDHTINFGAESGDVYVDYCWQFRVQIGRFGDRTIVLEVGDNPIIDSDHDG